MREVESLLLELDGDEIQEFAELHCNWYDSDYYDECEYDEEYDEWDSPADGHSIVDDALDVIREWVAETPENIEVLRAYVSV